MGVRTWLLRRAMGRLRISDDIVRHLSTFQRLGETVEVQLPTEVLPVGARTVLRALRTRAAAQVVETVMRVPGGDAVQRVYAVQDVEELTVVEFENASSLPFALALAVRPYNPEGLAVVERIQLVDRTVTVDGRPALLFPTEPARMAGSTFHGGDSMRIVTEGHAGTSLPELRCEAGLAQAAFLFPLAHRATLRVALPLVPERRTRRRRLARRRVERMPELPTALPSSVSVSRAWQAQTRRGLQFDLPDPALADAVEANRRYMLLFHDGADITPGPATYHRFWFRDAAYMLAAMDRYGLHAETAEVLSS